MPGIRYPKANYVRRYDTNLFCSSNDIKTNFLNTNLELNGF